MTDGEIRLYAQKLIENGCKSTHVWPNPIEGVDVKMTITPKGIYEFCYDFSEIVGTKAMVCYSPQKFVENLIRAFQAAASEIKDRVPAEIIEKDFHEAIQDTVDYLLVLMMLELCEPFAALPQIASNLARTLSYESLLNNEPGEITNKINKLIQEVNTRRKERILELRKQQLEALSAPQFVFCDVYEEQLAQWTKAKKFYRLNKVHKNWIEMLKLAYPDLDENLIPQLGASDRYTAQASTIALKDTAELLNIQNSKKADRTLRQYLTESRKLREQVSDREANKALDRYFDFVDAYLNEEELKEKLRTEFKAKLVQNRKS